MELLWLAGCRDRTGMVARVRVRLRIPEVRLLYEGDCREGVRFRNWLVDPGRIEVDRLGR